MTEISSFNRFFTQNLLDWYDRNKRNLPWRETKDPYKIWISEIILQQTRVDQGLPYYHRFLHTFPTLQKLALAEEQKVLSVWQGLGYYSRARNLHQGAKQLLNEYKGNFPTSFNEWLNIKGVGSYTAAAISSFCFKEQVPVLDGNVFRVLSRVFGITDDIASGKGKKIFWDKASELIPKKQPDLFNQALMEFGALHCTPKNPGCGHCVFKQHCFAYNKEMVDTLPVKIKKLVRKSRFFEYHVYLYNKQVLMRKRQKGDIWEGLFEFPLTEKISETALAKRNRGLANYPLLFQSEVIKHVLSHQDLFCKIYVLNVTTKKDWNALKKEFDAEVVPLSAIDEIPKPVLLTKFLNTHFFRTFNVQ